MKKKDRLKWVVTRTYLGNKSLLDSFYIKTLPQ